MTRGLGRSYGPPGRCGRLVALAGGVDRAGEFAESEGRAVTRAPADGLAVADVAVELACVIRDLDVERRLVPP